MTEFQKNTALLREQLGNGDIAIICERANCTQNTLYGAFKRESATEFTPKEKTAYETFVAFVNERVKEKERLNTRAADVAEKLKK